MNPEIKKRWVEALRSGEYRQGKIRLKGSSGFCCLGVLTDLYLKETNQDWTYCLKQNLYQFSNSSHLLCDEVMEWAELKNNNPSVIIDNNETSLAKLNDSNLDFLEIASLIESGDVK